MKIYFLFDFAMAFRVNQWKEGRANVGELQKVRNWENNRAACDPQLNGVKGVHLACRRKWWQTEIEFKVNWMKFIFNNKNSTVVRCCYYWWPNSYHYYLPLHWLDAGEFWFVDCQAVNTHIGWMCKRFGFGMIVISFMRLLWLLLVHIWIRKKKKNSRNFTEQMCCGVVFRRVSMLISVPFHPNSSQESLWFC